MYIVYIYYIELDNVDVHRTAAMQHELYIINACADLDGEVAFWLLFSSNLLLP